MDISYLTNALNKRIAENASEVPISVEQSARSNRQTEKKS